MSYEKDLETMHRRLDDTRIAMMIYEKPGDPSKVGRMTVINKNKFEDEEDCVKQWINMVGTAINNLPLPLGRASEQEIKPPRWVWLSTGVLTSVFATFFAILGVRSGSVELASVVSVMLACLAGILIGLPE